MVFVVVVQAIPSCRWRWFSQWHHVRDFFTVAPQWQSKTMVTFFLLFALHSLCSHFYMSVCLTFVFECATLIDETARPRFACDAAAVIVTKNGARPSNGTRKLFENYIFSPVDASFNHVCFVACVACVATRCLRAVVCEFCVPNAFRKPFRMFPCDVACTYTCS